MHQQVWYWYPKPVTIICSYVTIICPFAEKCSVICLYNDFIIRLYSGNIHFWVTFGNIMLNKLWLIIIKLCQPSFTQNNNSLSRPSRFALQGVLFGASRFFLNRLGHFNQIHDDVIKWNHFRVTDAMCWEFSSPVNFPHKGRWRGTLMFPVIRAWTKGWINNQDAGDLRRHRAHYAVTVMHTGRNISASIYYNWSS